MLKKITLFVTLICLIISSFAGCGGGAKNASGKAGSQIEISYWNSGLSKEWLDEVIKAFEAKYPQYTVSYTASASQNAVNAGFGVDGDTVDIYMSAGINDLSKMECLDDVLDSTADGDKKTIREKFLDGYLKIAKSPDGKIYSLTFGGGILGFVYNTEHFKKAGIEQIPRTTNELATACDSLYSAGYKPLCHFSPTGYWHWMSEVFFSQYDGMDYYINNFYGCTDEKGNSPSKEVFTKKDGRYQTLKVYEKIITPEYILDGSNSGDHITAQTQFINGNVSMMVTGSWITTEMKSVGGLEKFAMMRTPVISAITDKLDTVKTDSNLRRLISTLDDIADGKKKAEDFADGENYKIGDMTVSKHDWDYVHNARFTLTSVYNGDVAVIPKYSDNIKGAKEFLRFLYSDEGYKVYEDILKIPMPLSLSDGTQLNTKNWNDFEISQLNLIEEADYVIGNGTRSEHRIFSDGGASAFAGYNYVSALCTNNSRDRKTANQIWQIVQDRINDNYENSWLKNIKNNK